MARVLEISRVSLFKHCLPQETTRFSLGAPLTAGEEGAVERFSVRNVWRVVCDLRAGVYDLVVLPAVDISFSDDARWAKRRLRALVRTAASTRLATVILEVLFRWKDQIVIFEDLADRPALSPEVCALVPGFLAYFKREFYPEQTLREGAHWRSINERVEPWSLFLPTLEFAPDASQKKSDVFYAGHCHNQMRKQGLLQLQRLANRGYRIDVPQGRLGYREYMQRMAEAWLVWSPEGFGWDCYRHYEAAYAGAVPVINEPAASRGRPYEDGVHCFFYRPTDDGSLEEALARALTDKERLRAMAARARERVLARYTRPALTAGMQSVIVRRLRAAGRSSRLLTEWAEAGDADANVSKTSPFLA